MMAGKREQEDDMPRITAATVAEHRDVQVRAVLEAAHALIGEDGRLPAMGRIAERAGLARPSLYQYFPSRGDLLLALAADATPRWLDAVRVAMDEHTDPVDRIQAYFRASVSRVLEGAHTVGELLAAEPGLEQAAAEQAQRLHAEAAAPLIAELRALGAEDAEAAARMLSASLHSVGPLLGEGMELEAALDLLRRVTEPYLRSLPAGV